jgi:undecaprenyl pyrophosphate phosphatase UppP
MYKIIDYVFFRVYNFYKNKKDSTPILMACLVLSLFPFSTLLSINILFEIVAKNNHFIFEKYIIVIALLSVLFFYYRRYTNITVLNKLIELYKNESKHIKNIRGWYLVLTLLVVIFLPVFLGYIKRN